VIGSSEMVVGNLDLLVGEAFAQQGVLEFEDRVLQVWCRQGAIRQARSQQAVLGTVAASFGRTR